MSRAFRLSVVFLLALAALFVITGCSSVGALLRSNVSGLPYWYYEPEMGSGRGNTGIVCEGRASTQRQAELLAYSAIMRELSELTGYDLGQEAYRELSMLGTISELGLTIRDEYYETSDGMVTVYLHVTIDEEALAKVTTEESRKRRELSASIRSLVLQGDEAIKSGKELSAVKDYLKAMALSYGLDYIDSEYSFDELYPVVYNLLSVIRMSIVSARADSATCTIGLTRRGSFVSSAVSSAEILATFYAEDTRGLVYRDSFVCVTDQSGQFFFNSINSSLVRSGSVEFSLDLADELSELEAVAGVAAVSELRRLVESKTINFHYARTYKLGSIAVSVIEHDTLGYVTGSDYTCDYVVDKFLKSGAYASAYHPELDDEEDVLYDYVHDGGKAPCLLVMRVGVVDSVESRNGVVTVNVEGLATLFDTRTSKVLYRSDVIYANAFAETYDQALEKAFSNLADIAYTLLKVVYV